MGSTARIDYMSSIAKPERDLRLTFANCESDVIAAQRLRHSVFAGEMGAKLHTPVDGVDEDEFDPYCEHLIVRDEAVGEVVGTYRILTPDAAKRIGKCYTGAEFDLSNLMPIRSRMVELGRSCVAPEYRSGGVISLLWTGLTDFMIENHFEHLIGCASISLEDGGHTAASINKRVQAKHLCPEHLRVAPRHALPLDNLKDDLTVTIPPLIKGYLRVGAWVCGNPAWDKDFNSADLPMLLSMSNINKRYFRFFSSSTTAPLSAQQ